MNYQKEIVKTKLLILKCYQADVNEIACPFQWWEKHEVLFPTIGFPTQQILKFVSSQIETKRIFFLVGIFTNQEDVVYNYIT